MMIRVLVLLAELQTYILQDATSHLVFFLNRGAETMESRNGEHHGFLYVFT